MSGTGDIPLGNGVVMDREGYELFRDGKVIGSLGHAGGVIVEMLVRRPGRAVAAEFIFAALYDDREEPRQNATLRQHISRLRRQLADCGASARVRNIAGFGYAMTVPL